jgi:hypothetical protein
VRRAGVPCSRVAGRLLACLEPTILQRGYSLVCTVLVAAALVAARRRDWPRYGPALARHTRINYGAGAMPFHSSFLIGAPI